MPHRWPESGSGQHCAAYCRRVMNNTRLQRIAAGTGTILLAASFTAAGLGVAGVTENDGANSATYDGDDITITRTVSDLTPEIVDEITVTSEITVGDNFDGGT